MIPLEFSELFLNNKKLGRSFVATLTELEYWFRPMIILKIKKMGVDALKQFCREPSGPLNQF